MARRKTRKDVRVDWSLGGGTASTAALSALGLAASGAVGHAAGMAAWWGAAGAAAGGLGSVASGVSRHAGPGWMLHRLGTWAGAGGWLSWALVNGIWDVNTLAVLGVGAAAAGGTSVLAQRRTPAGGSGQVGQPGAAVVLRSASQLALDWQARLARQTRRSGWQVTDVERWASRAGYTLTVVPPAGVTRRTLAPYLDALAGDAQLPEGCGVEPAPGPHRGALRLHVSTVNRMSQVIDYPEEYPATSIMEPLTLGEHRDSTPAQVRWREHSALFTGQKGSGKTTLLQVSTAEAARCADALVWHIDLTGGGLSLPWLDPWLEGQTGRPAVDWAACTPEDAKAMVQAALRISKSRKSSGWRRKKAANATLLPVGEDMPAIVLIVDEGKQLLNPTKKGIWAELRRGLEEIQDIARDSAITPVLSSLRATQDTLSTSVKTQATTRVGMCGSEEAELAYLLGWNHRLSNEDLAGPGTGFLTDGATPRPFRVYNLAPSVIAELAHITSERRPELDEASVQAAGAAYTRRYEQMRATFTEIKENGGSENEAAGVAAVRHLHPVGMTADTWLEDPETDEDDYEDDDLEEAEEMSPPAVRAAAEWTLPRRPATTTVEEVPTPAAGDAGLVRRALGAIDATGDTRIPSEELARALGFADQAALAAALRPLGVRPRQYERAGRKIRGYDRDDVEAAQRDRAAAPA